MLRQPQANAEAEANSLHSCKQGPNRDDARDGLRKQWLGLALGS